MLIPESIRDAGIMDWMNRIYGVPIITFKSC